jgi:prolipoprotein diacylglyceryl transferase
VDYHQETMTLAYIPSPTISQFSIGPATIHIYALCILMGIVLAVWITTTRWKKLGGNFDQVLDITLVSVPAGIIGARLYHIITTPERFFGPDGDWAEMFRIWNGGLGIWGGVLFGALAAWAWCRHKHYPMALLADAIAPGLLVAQAVGRLGNWFNQELYGAPTTLPWGLKLNMEGTAIGHSEQCYDGATCPSGTLFHPTFLYEMIWNLIDLLLFDAGLLVGIRDSFGIVGFDFISRLLGERHHGIRRILRFTVFKTLLDFGDGTKLLRQQVSVFAHLLHDDE